MDEQLLETWRIHSRIAIYVLSAIAPDAFISPKPAKGRHFAEMFAHIHNTRLMWLQSAAPDLLEGVAKIEKRHPLDPGELKVALTASGHAIEMLLQSGLAAGRIKGFKPHAPAFLGYMIAHESYHQGEIGIALAQAGYPLDKKTAFGMWEWGVR